MESKSITPDKAQIRLETLCMRAEHCEGEMREKLRKWGIAQDDADKIIDKLKHDRFIDDARFTRSYMRDKLWLARWGRIKVSMALAQKRVRREIIQEAMDGIDEERYVQSLAELITAKLKSKPELLESAEGRAKIYRFAASRGYESSIISKALKSIVK
ncbi:MAG: RecX family transcriptional regulator [Bacteroidales bacterium]|nr:RecX family transcriptional regulator [Bacteroidales bacterium]